MIKRLLATMAISMLPVTVSASPINQFTDLLIFGDSLSDVGNAFVATGGVTPDPADYPAQQFTDGNTWAAQIGAGVPSLLGGTNYAFGGAKAATDADGIPDLGLQLGAFGLANPTLGSNPLAAIYLGGNDMRDALASLNPASSTTIAEVLGGTKTVQDVVDGFFATNAALDQAITAISAGIGFLNGSGIDDFIVLGLPNFARVPEVLGAASLFSSVLGSQAGQLALEIATATSIRFNSELQGVVNNRPTGTNAAFVDVFTLFEGVAADPLAFGFADLTTPCLPLLNANVVANCDGFLFYDSVHPTEAAHALVAAEFTSAVASIPLPAGGVLLLTGFAGFAMLRRRKEKLASIQ